MPPSNRPSRRYGAAELFGRAVATLQPGELRTLASTPNREVTCPFKPNRLPCNKPGGVCSLGLFERNTDGGVSAIGAPVTTCPNRFLEQSVVTQWIGGTLLGTTTPQAVAELPFLMSAEGNGVPTEDEVGRIDNVLVNRDDGQLKWCAVEAQAVYFSGGRMESDFAVMRTWNGPGMLFPAGRRRPDFRSSGPKRLMPQLQIKVPTLRRWGKKMAVVVDRAFWSSLRGVRPVGHLSNADIVWFVADYHQPEAGAYSLHPGEAVFTSLENAVEGLTGGVPVSLEQFELAILRRLERLGAK